MCMYVLVFIKKNIYISIYKNIYVYNIYIYIWSTNKYI